jgi:hypothetical protein
MPKKMGPEDVSQAFEAFMARYQWDPHMTLQDAETLLRVAEELFRQGALWGYRWGYHDATDTHIADVEEWCKLAASEQLRSTLGDCPHEA